VMFGVGPGQLLADANMIGIDPGSERSRMEEALEVILRLFDGESVTAKTDWFDLRDAVLQLPRYSDFEVCVTGAISASGPSLAGRYGTGLLSLAATDPTGCDLLESHWDIVETEAKEHGHVPDRARWRLVGPMHIAETVEQARKEVLYGMPWLVEYLSHVSPSAVKNFDDPLAVIDSMNESGRGVIGTPDMAVAQLNRLLDKSGGFGTYLFLGADYARWQPTLRSYELFAEEVMPRINGQIDKLQQGVDRVLESYEGAETTARAQKDATARYRETREPQLDRLQGEI
jgi:limonene 1,2-monooxygenase